MGEKFMRILENVFKLQVVVKKLYAKDNMITSRVKKVNV